ncbi:tRNA uridine-5-carboxymethylaminomethyl(34) synthesis GTPase MnmE [Candidatus Deianiraea vastatrix]|uniref:tRNA modification GTPase MnmE n=1 Tax=Candidatus Deianiraea vastatrix TaxID=2163644 RepID=A0A5B8XGY2_9RICK|nr:tRNA uridine-5-carboxymethylaminomethyl(34) synthesis GTPase MnmE [Candidatus Deianiraea vastatrix]QED23464.1 tRNA modification GTPase MnmE [Candidatus Deianiraea vastatrix]
MQHKYNLNDTIFAPITPKIGGAVCIFRISGSDALKIKSHLSCPDLKPNECVFSKLFDAEKQLLDEVLVTFFKAPKSFTGQDCIEISLHASLYIYEKFIALMRDSLNFRFAENGEFLYRAVMNQKMDINHAEGINMLIKSQSASQHSFAMSQMSKDLSDVYRSWYDKICEIYALIEANIDFSDQEIPQDTIKYIENELFNLTKQMNKYINSPCQSQIFDGIDIAILGRPNAGKSSLINTICNKDVSIVSNIPGTTRDLVSKSVVISGFLVNIIDTAGIRENSSDEIENQGILRAISAVKSSAIRIFVFENGEIDMDLLEKYYMPSDILLCSKSDLINEEVRQKKVPNIEKYSIKSSDFLFISTKNGDGIDQLLSHIKAKIEENMPSISDNICVSDRQKDILIKCYSIITSAGSIDEIEIFAESMRSAMAQMGQIFGNMSIEDILGQIFSKFCIGK